MTKGRLDAQLQWARANPERSEAKAFLSLATMYMRSADVPTYALLMEATEQVNRAMRKEGK